MAVEDSRYHQLYDRLERARNAVIKWYERGKKDWNGRKMARPYSYQEGDAFRQELRYYFDSLNKDEAARLAGNFAFEVAKNMLKDRRFHQDAKAVIWLSCKPFMNEADKLKLDALMQAIISGKSSKPENKSLGKNSQPINPKYVQAEIKFGS